MQEYIFYQIFDQRDKRTVIVDHGTILLPDREWFAVLLVRKMYDLKYLPIVRYSDGRNNAEYERLNETATHYVHAHITTTPENGFCIPNSPAFNFFLHVMRD